MDLKGIWWNSVWNEIIGNELPAHMKNREFLE
jgi:hypothetical protein